MNWWGKSPETTPDSILKIGFHFLRINKSCVNQKKNPPCEGFFGLPDWSTKKNNYIGLGISQEILNADSKQRILADA